MHSIFGVPPIPKGNFEDSHKYDQATARKKKQHTPFGTPVTV